MQIIAKFLHDKSGATAIEYGLIAALIASWLGRARWAIL